MSIKHSSLIMPAILFILNGVAQKPIESYKDINRDRGTFVINEIRNIHSSDKNNAQLSARVAGLNCLFIKGKPTTGEIIFIDSIPYKIDQEGTITVTIKPGWHTMSAGNPEDHGLYPLEKVRVKFKKRRVYSIDFYLAFKSGVE